jgi:integrase
MPFLMKISTIRYVKDGKRVPAGTPGATRKVEKSRNWYGVWKEGGRVIARIALSSDKRSSMAKMMEMDKQREREGAALADPFKDDKARPIGDHLNAYLAEMKGKGRDAKYIRDTENTLLRVSKFCGFKCLADFNPDKLEKLLNELDCSARRKNDYRGSLVFFSTWLVHKRKLPKNPFLVVPAIEKQPERLRRSLPLDELETLLETARERPLKDVRTIRRGKNKGQETGRVKLVVEERKIVEGHGKWLTYKTAILTGLRRGEMKEVRVENLDLADPAELNLSGKFTKNGKDARIPIRADHAEELRQWIQVSKRKSSDLLFKIPCASAAMLGLRRDLVAAGIPFELNGRVFDWHCFRVEFATLLTAAKVHERIRLLLMRHADRHLTDHYDDEEHHWQAMREAVEALPPLKYLAPLERKERTDSIKASLDVVNDWVMPQDYRDYLEGKTDD